jgi:hypothetical protein
MDKLTAVLQFLLRALVAVIAKLFPFLRSRDGDQLEDADSGTEATDPWPPGGHKTQPGPEPEPEAAKVTALAGGRTVASGTTVVRGVDSAARGVVVGSAGGFSAPRFTVTPSISSATAKSSASASGLTAGGTTNGASAAPGRASGPPAGLPSIGSAHWEAGSLTAGAGAASSAVSGVATGSVHAQVVSPGPTGPGTGRPGVAAATGSTSGTGGGGTTTSPGTGTTSRTPSVHYSPPSVPPAQAEFLTATEIVGGGLY